MEQKKRTYGQKASPAVEAPAEDTVKVRSLRLSDDTVEELNAAKKALDVRTMDEAMQAILDTFSMSMAKDAIPVLVFGTIASSPYSISVAQIIV